ncbi:hypothetical protein SUGI_0624410 [Cryptomeria japonica]|uniref:17.3 kDa class II heat shock protein n=1 Tax=Cryptomeria japonica TaxID=3369 RepID=UPI0024147A81|nr:17.3 kDa class II heat shock protein [Cryptomeria japonica]GLJ31162.1 hypothetical protein SUGI_0624410 [Cryptomeria japonica]
MAARSQRNLENILIDREIWITTTCPAFIIDMPGLKNNDIKVQLQDKNVLTISGERKRAEEEDVIFIRIERRVGKFMRKFTLPEGCNLEAISASCHDGVLSVTVPKLPPPEPKKPKTIEVKVA